MKKGLLLNGLEFMGKRYEYNDIKGHNKDITVPKGFYGGRCNIIAKTEDKGINLIVEKDHVIDIYFHDPEALTKDQLKAILDKKNKEYDTKDTKEQLLNKLGIITEE